ncbi:MAG TPA: response regulator transcription factor [Acidimicrobiales bacterium]|nr:response regulator transcription factor [Acidimicrobiales bacterium]
MTPREGNGPVRVVIADDEPDVRLLLRLQLNGSPGIDVVGEAGDGMQTLEMCRELQPDAVVVDLLMPKMMGIEAIERLHSEMPGIGVVAYTATAGEHVRREMDRLGVSLLLKSGDIGQLVDALRAAIARAVD